MMRYLSVCSGIEAVSVAVNGLPFEAVAFSEVESFPRAVLTHHYPDVPLHGDFTTIKGDEYGSVELLVGGTPCQSFSVAGNRLGLDDSRGNLAIEFLLLAQRLNTRWLLWENVPGVTSSWSDEAGTADKSNDFDTFLSLLRQCGYSACWRILDAQYFGVPQRRRRVFVVAYLGDWRPAAAVLFEREGLQRDITPRRKEGEDTSAYSQNGIGEYGKQHGLLRATGGDAGAGSEVLIPSVAWAIQARDSKGVDSDTKQGHLIPTFGFNHQAGAGAGLSYSESLSPPLLSHQKPAVYIDCPIMVRRLTPTECERLQGFPDGYTLVPYRGRPASDAPRYRVLGNSMAVPVMRWLLDRIQKVDSLVKAL